MRKRNSFEALIEDHHGRCILILLVVCLLFTLILVKWVNDSKIEQDLRNLNWSIENALSPEDARIAEHELKKYKFLRGIKDP